MNQKGVVISGLIYALLVFFLLLMASILTILWYRQSAINNLSKDANSIYDDIYVPSYSKNFAYTGNSQTFTATKTGKYQIQLWGAQGSYGTPGKGAYVEGTITLVEDQSLYVYVGQQYSLANATSFNGGTGSSGGHPGGGATDVRLVSGTWSDTASLRSRIIVAGGGGAGTIGGAGGTLSGINGGVATGGTQTVGGTQDASYGNGQFGIGGQGCGGGGGYYGGGGAQCATGAGGGSSFISGYTGCNAINATGVHTGQPNHYSGNVFSSGVMIAGNASMTSPTGEAETGHAGNGYARITYMP